MPTSAGSGPNLAPTRLRRLADRLSQPVATDSLVAFRIGFGLLMLAVVARFFAHGWIDKYTREPSVFFTTTASSGFVRSPGRSCTCTTPGWARWPS
jgi:hypothetical protein